MRRSHVVGRVAKNHDACDRVDAPDEPRVLGRVGAVPVEARTLRQHVEARRVRAHPRIVLGRTAEPVDALKERDDRRERQRPLHEGEREREGRVGEHGGEALGDDRLEEVPVHVRDHLVAEVHRPPLDAPRVSSVIGDGAHDVAAAYCRLEPSTERKRAHVEQSMHAPRRRREVVDSAASALVAIRRAHSPPRTRVDWRGASAFGPAASDSRLAIDCRKYAALSSTPMPLRPCLTAP